MALLVVHPKPAGCGGLLAERRIDASYETVRRDRLRDIADVINFLGNVLSMCDKGKDVNEPAHAQAWNEFIRVLVERT